jgi:alanine racemase
MRCHRPTRAEIDLRALRHNFLEIRRRAGPDRQVLAVVKADAYGHGAVRVAGLLKEAGADLFGVALAEEGETLRRAGIDRPILVLGGVFPGQEDDFLEHDLAPVLYDLATARRLDAAARSAGRCCGYHLKVDTGMTRIGFDRRDLPAALETLGKMTGLRMDGVLSHLALADTPEDPFTATQVDRFGEVMAVIRGAGMTPRWIHLSNSAAIFSRDVPGCNLVRPGIALYGGLPSGHFAGLDLRPVMSLRSALVQIRDIPAGTGVSYGHRFVARRRSRVAAVPIGYADGYSRLLSGRGEALVRGRRVPVAGTVCMDWILLDVTDLPEAAVGDEVTLLGVDGDDRISAEEWADRIGTINYEVFCGIGKRVPRVYEERTES